MALASQSKRVVIEKFSRHKKDVGSPEVQVAVLSERIAQLHEHFKAFPKDHHSKRGLLNMVSRRRRLLEYLKTHDTERYKNLVQKLGVKR